MAGERAPAESSSRPYAGKGYSVFPARITAGIANTFIRCGLRRTLSLPIPSANCVEMVTAFSRDALRQELLQFRGLRIIENLGRRAHFMDFALMHKYDAVADLAGEIHLMSYHDDGHAFRRQRLNNL